MLIRVLDCDINLDMVQDKYPTLAGRSYIRILLLNVNDASYRFIVKKDAPGLQATKIENKIGLRIVQNGDIVLKKVLVPDEDRLSGVNSFQDTNKVLSY